MPSPEPDASAQPGSSAVELTFAVVNWNTCALLDSCLASIQESTAGVRRQILVADNGSTDGSPEMVRRKYPDATLVTSDANLGFARGHASLLRHSRGAYHVLVNSDVRMTGSCVEALRRRFQTSPEVGVVGCQIRNPDGSIQPSCRRFPRLTYYLLQATGVSRLFRRSARLNGYRMAGFDHRRSRQVDQVSGALFAIRRELIDDIGFLDDGYFMYYEEVDYCLRAKRAGYQVWFDADGHVVHVGRSSSDQVRELTIRRSLRSMRRFYCKNHGRATYWPLLLIVAIDAVSHIAHSLASRRSTAETGRGYLLGWWDLAARKPADWSS